MERNAGDLGKCSCQALLGQYTLVNKHLAQQCTAACLLLIQHVGQLIGGEDAPLDEVVAKPDGRYRAAVTIAGMGTICAPVDRHSAFVVTLIHR